MSIQHLVDAVNPTSTPQAEALPGQVQNSAGAFSFPVDDWTRLDRFLVLGTGGGSYYASERKLSKDNAEVVRRCLAMDAVRTVHRVVEISEAGRAPKNDQAVFALALALKYDDPRRPAASVEARRLAARAVPKVCRIGTHLFQLAEAVNVIGGWGRNTCKAFGSWYVSQPADDLAYQVAKYQQRNGWSHLDVLRLSHAGNLPHSQEHEAVFRWVHRGHAKNKTNPLAAREVACWGGKNKGLTRDYPAVSSALLPRILHAFDEVMSAETPSQVVKAIVEHGLPRECVPSKFLTSPEVWNALLRSGKGMPMTALVRNLGKMSEVGLLTPLSEAAGYVCQRLRDATELRRARVHPIALLMAQNVYEQGHGVKGSLTWKAVQPVLKALDDAFYLAFATVEPTNKRRMLCLDVSGSMDRGFIAGTTLTPRAAAAAMACVTARVEPQFHCVVFTSRAPGEWFAGTGRSMYPDYRAAISQFNIGDDNVSTIAARASALPMGGTDCALPMLYAAANRIPVDAFEIYTDNETWAGDIHPSMALKEYRQKMGIAAKLIVVGMVANEFSIADPTDAGMLDVVGFDAAAPQVMADFIRA